MYEYLLDKYKKNIFLFGISIGFLFSTISIILAKSFGGVCSSYLALSFFIIPVTQILVKIIEEEEKNIKEDLNILERHKNFIYFYFGLFLGISFAYYIWFLIFPDSDLFYLQYAAIKKMHHLASLKFFDKEMFGIILINNLKVLILTFILSFLFGAGAIFIISWNASILGVFLGIIARNYIGDPVTKYLLYPMYILIVGILPHGFFEFLAFFLVALSGNMIGMALIKSYKIGSTKFNLVMRDAILLFIFSLAFLILAAFIESTI